MLTIKNNTKVLICILSFLCIILTGCTQSQQQEVTSTVQNVIDLPEVKSIKEMTTDEGIKLGDLIEAGVSSPTYELYDPAEDGNTYITIKGTVNYKGVDVVATIQYKKMEDKSYEFYTITYNDIPQNQLEIDAFFNYLYEKYEEQTLENEKNEADSNATNGSSEKKFTEEDIDEENLKIESRIEEVGNSVANAYVYALNKDGDKVWEKSWKNLKLTELEIMSEITETEDGIIYVEVYGNLYAIDRKNGNEIWGNVLVGNGTIPTVDDNGTIYCIGYYGPFITAISPNGSIMWTKDYEDIYWPYEIKVSKTNIYVNYYGNNSNTSVEEGGLAVIAKDGTLISKNPSEEKFFNNTSASSTLSSTNNNYVSNNVIDGKDETAWVEGVDGNGVGEYIELMTDTEEEINVIEIRNGYKKSNETFENNNSVKKIQIQLSNDITVVKELGEYINDVNYIVLDEPVKTNHIKFTILEVYDGEKYDDTCISEINVY